MSRAFTKERDDAPEPPIVLPRRQVGEIPPPPQDHGIVGMTARVRVSGVGAEPRTFTIVAPEDSDVAAGRVAIDSPLADALIGARKGDRVTWHRPAGDVELAVLDVRYGPG